MNGEQIEELLRASSDDEAVLSFAVPDRIFGFHAQQAVEKLLKALIAGRGSEYHFTHDIRVLVATATNLGETLPSTPFPLSELTDFAVLFRYTEPRDLKVADRDAIRQTTFALREHVRARIAALGY